MCNGYFTIKPDGAPMKCIDCGKTDDEPKIKITGIFGAHHIECVDSDWIKTAINFGDI